MRMGIGLHSTGEAIAVSRDRVASECLAFLKEALGNFHPRDFRIRLWDGSVWDAEPGEPARFTLVLQTPDGFRAMFRSPSEITLGEAYFHEDLDVEGDFGDAFRLADRLVRMREYFGRAFRLLRPGGVFLNHGIACHSGIPSNPGPSFSDHYIFPDGELLPIATTLRAAEACGFEVRDVESLREHYVLTLRHWLRRLEERRREACRFVDERTFRLWKLYLAGAAHTFRTGRNNVFQVLLVKPLPGEKKKEEVEKKDHHRAAGSKGAQRGPSC